MAHGIDLATFQHTVPGIALVLVGVFYLLRFFVKEVQQFALKAIEAIRAIRKKWREMEKELGRDSSEVKTRLRLKGRAPKKPVRLNPTVDIKRRKTMQR